MDKSQNAINLRQYYAAMALKGILANPNICSSTNEDGKINIHKAEDLDILAERVLYISRKLAKESLDHLTN